MQTFRIIDVDEACAELRDSDVSARSMQSELPEITEHHALAADGNGAALVCAHDTANGASHIFEIERSVTAAFAADEPTPEVFHERLGGHLNRLARAVFN